MVPAHPCGTRKSSGQDVDSWPS